MTTVSPPGYWDLQHLSQTFPIWLGPPGGSWQPPPRSHVGAHTIKRTVSVCPHFLASISRCRLLSQDRKLCFCRYYLSFLDIFKNIHLK